MLVGEIDLVAGRDSEGNATGRGSFNSEGAFIAAANGGQFGSISGETTLEAAEYDRYSKSSGWGIGLSFGGTPVANAVDTLMKGDSLEDAYAQNSKTYSALKALSGSSVGETRQGLINASLQVRGGGNALLDAFNSDKDGAFEKAFNQQFNPFKDMGTGKDATGQSLTPTVTVGFNTFEKSSEWSQSTATSIATGGDLEIMSGQNDGGHNLNIMDGTQFSIGGDPFVNLSDTFVAGFKAEDGAPESGLYTMFTAGDQHENSRLHLNSGKDIIGMAQKNTYSNESSQTGVSVSVSFDMATGAPVGFGFNTGEQSSSGHTWTYVDLDTDRLKLSTHNGGNVDFSGVDATGIGEIELAVEGDVNLTSLQEHHEYANSSMGINIDIPNKTGSLGLGEQSGSRDVVTQQTALAADLITGNVGGDINLTGAYMDSANPGELIVGGDVNTVDIVNVATGENRGLTLGVDANALFPKLSPPVNQNNTTTSTTRSGISSTINLVGTDGHALDLPGLNRDVDGLNEVLADPMKEDLDIADIFPETIVQETLSEFGSDVIGDLFVTPVADDPVLNKILHLGAHTFLGCAAGSVTGDCGAGALAHFTGEAGAMLLAEMELSNSDILDGVALLSAATALATDNDADLTMRLAGNAAEHNYLTHAEQMKFLEEFNKCKQKSNCDTFALFDKYYGLSDDNMDALWDACIDRSSPACIEKVIELADSIVAFSDSLGLADNEMSHLLLSNQKQVAMEEDAEVSYAFTEEGLQKYFEAIPGISKERALALAAAAATALAVARAKNLDKQNNRDTSLSNNDRAEEKDESITVAGTGNSGRQNTTRVCSFHGDTQVLTATGYQSIRGLKAGIDQVWSRNAQTGEMGWKGVEAQYSNPYPARVSVTIKDTETGEVQTIVSNRIHPYFVQLPEHATQAVPSSEGHEYQGKINRGQWVDAQHLKVGYRLLNPDESWAEVTAVQVKEAPLTAYNLTVADFHTYFVAGTAGAPAVWVHNNCIFSSDTTRKMNADVEVSDTGMATVNFTRRRATSLDTNDINQLAVELANEGVTHVVVNAGQIVEPTGQLRRILGKLAKN